MFGTTLQSFKQKFKRLLFIMQRPTYKFDWWSNSSLEASWKCLLYFWNIFIKAFIYLFWHIFETIFLIFYTMGQWRIQKFYIHKDNCWSNSCLVGRPKCLLYILKLLLLYKLYKKYLCIPHNPSAAVDCLP